MSSCRAGGAARASLPHGRAEAPAAVAVKLFRSVLTTMPSDAGRAQEGANVDRPSISTAREKQEAEVQSPGRGTGGDRIPKCAGRLDSVVPEER
jgi:hypothetical protein